MLELALIELARRVAAARSASAAASKGLSDATIQLQTMQPQQTAITLEQQLPPQHKSIVSNSSGRPPSRPTSPLTTDLQGLQKSRGSASGMQGSSTAQVQASRGARRDDVARSSPASTLADQDCSLTGIAPLPNGNEESNSDASNDSLAGLGGFSDVLSSWITASAPRKQIQYPRETSPCQPSHNSSCSMPSLPLLTADTAPHAVQATESISLLQLAAQVPSVRPLLHKPVFSAFDCQAI